MEYKRPKGTQDYLDLPALASCQIVRTFKSVSRKYGYRDLIIPTFEMAELYQRQMPTADVVTKELYEFFDKKNRRLALRPEFTAGVVRALVENKWYTTIPLRVCYFGNVFRYERPQANRYREFSQFGCELFGDNSLSADCEIIQICYEALVTLKISDFSLQINDIGDSISRQRWIQALRTYFTKYVNQLTSLSQNRIHTNPLRIIDDKVDGVKEFVKAAPRVSEFWTDVEKKRFEQLQMMLNTLNIPFQVNCNLVRGLDYYTNFVFEFVKNDAGSQDTLVAGGRYNNLVNEIGKIDLPAVGFSVGVERLVNEYLRQTSNLSQLQNDFSVHVVVGLSNWNHDVISQAEFAAKLRSLGLRVIVTSSDNFKKNLATTKRLGVNYYLECSEDDFAKPNSFFVVHNVQKVSKTKPLAFDELVKLLNGSLSAVQEELLWQ